MIHRTFLTIAASAAGAFGLTLAILTPARLEAVGPSTLPAKVEPPVLKIDGVQISALYDGKTPQLRMVLADNTQSAGKITLLAVNSTDESATVPVTIHLKSRTANPMSRVPAIDREYYSEEQMITLAPHESRVITVAPEKALPQTSTVTVALESGKQTLPMMTLSVGPSISIERPAARRG